MLSQWLYSITSWHLTKLMEVAICRGSLCRGVKVPCSTETCCSHTLPQFTTRQTTTPKWAARHTIKNAADCLDVRRIFSPGRPSVLPPALDHPLGSQSSRSAIEAHRRLERKSAACQSAACQSFMRHRMFFHIRASIKGIARIDAGLPVGP
jgi:hypothetical protein